jgi:hypothetical protein
MAYPGTNTLAAVASRSCRRLIFNFQAGGSGGGLFGGGDFCCCGCLLCSEQVSQAPDLLIWACDVGDGLLVFSSDGRGNGGGLFRRGDGDGVRGDGDGLCSGGAGAGLLGVLLLEGAPE